MVVAILDGNKIAFTADGTMEPQIMVTIPRAQWELDGKPMSLVVTLTLPDA